MTPDQVDQILRRSSDDVRATVVRHTVPPPIETLGGRRHPVRRSVLGIAAASVTVTLGLAIVVARTPSVDPLIEAPGPVSTVPLAVPPPDAPVEDLCRRVVDITRVLADPPDEVAAWVALGDELDGLAAQVAQSRPELDDGSTRRYDRFAALAGQAVSLGEQGGFTPAATRSHDAVAVAQELVEFVAVPGCELQLPRSDDEEEPG